VKPFERRVRHLGLAFSLLYASVLGRYFQLQVFDHDRYALESRKRRILEESIPHRRGSLYDRGGRLLVRDERSFDVVFRPGYFTRGGVLGALERLSALFGPSRAADPRLAGASPADDVLSLRAADLAGRGTAGDEGLAAMKRLAGIAGDGDGSFDAWTRAADGGSTFGEAIGPTGTLVLRHAIATSFAALRDALAAGAVPRRATLSAIRGAATAAIDAILAVRAGDVRSIASNAVRREAERALANLFDLPSPDVRTRLRKARRFDSLESALSLPGGESIRERARAALLDEDRDLEAAAALLGLTAERLLDTLDAELLLSGAVVRARTALGHDPAAFPLLSERELERRYQMASGDHPFRPRTIARDVPADTALELAASRRGLAGLAVQESTERRTLVPIAPHLLGFVGARDPGRTAGRAGLEAALDGFLAGRNGLEIVERDRRGREVEVIERTDPVAGEDVVLTLDASLQAAAERALAGRHGGAIVVDPRTGEVLAAASAPGFAIDELRTGYARLAADSEHRPLLSRVTRRARQPYPGSTFKIAVALAALEEGLVTPETRFHCRGYLHRPGEFTCLGVHGDADLRTALEKSCNVYFYRVGEALGGARLDAWARRLGFGARTGLEVADDEGALLFGRKGSWTTADSRFLAIGQVDVEATVAQVARMTCALAGGGELPELRLVRSIGGKPARRPPPERLPLSPRTLDVVREALRAVVETGTAAHSGLSAFSAAGKSGTAQTGRRDGGSPDHAWFTGYAPASDPAVVVTVLLEFEGRHGGDAAAPVAAEILRSFFERRK